MRTFYLGWEICPTLSGKLQARVKFPTVSGKSDAEKLQTPSAKSQTLVSTQIPLDTMGTLLDAFPLSWSNYVQLMSVEDDFARWFYEEEAIRGAWTVRQLARQIGTQFFERTALSRNKEAMILKARQAKPEDVVTLEEAVRDPYMLEFLDLKDEYSETDLEDAIIRHLETFLLELGDAFTFVARQRRIRIGNVWYRMDLVLFHRLLRCLVIIDLKIGEFTHADAGQMNLYLNYANEHMVMSGEDAPVGLILCSKKDDAVVHYAMGGIQAKVFAAKYMTELPSPEVLREEILKTQHAIASRTSVAGRNTREKNSQRVKDRPGGHPLRRALGADQKEDSGSHQEPARQVQRNASGPPRMDPIRRFGIVNFSSPHQNAILATQSTPSPLRHERQSIENLFPGT